MRLKKIADIVLMVPLIGILMLVFKIQPTAAVDWWPMFHHDLCNTGYSTSESISNSISWTYTTGSVLTSPAVADGNIYLGSIDGKVYAFEPLDSDRDGVPDDGDGNGILGDNPCIGGEAVDCDDNCPNNSNPLQENPDSDGLGSVCDNCPDDYNPDQLDSDNQDGGDVCDICPGDNTDTCDPSGSVAGIIDETGGEISIPDNSCTIHIPPGAVDTDTTFSITNIESGYILETDLGDTQTVLVVQLGCGAENLNQPVTVRLEWQDQNDDGLVDGTDYNEEDIFVVKDGELISTPCTSDECVCSSTCTECRCNLNLNYFEIDVTSFSEFSLVIPLDNDVDDVPDNFDGVEDNCPETPNGPEGGTCTTGAIGNPCIFDSDCGAGGFCSTDQENSDSDGVGDVCDNCLEDSNPEQEDTHPPGGNNCGDTCECEGDLNGDGQVAGADTVLFKADYNRTPYLNEPCPACSRNGYPCEYYE